MLPLESLPAETTNPYTQNVRFSQIRASHFALMNESKTFLNTLKLLKSLGFSFLCL